MMEELHSSEEEVDDGPQFLTEYVFTYARKGNDEASSYSAQIVPQLSVPQLSPRQLQTSLLEHKHDNEPKEHNASKNTSQGHDVTPGAKILNSTSLDNVHHSEPQVMELMSIELSDSTSQSESSVSAPTSNLSVLPPQEATENTLRNVYNIPRPFHQKYVPLREKPPTLPHSRTTDSRREPRYL
jgi:hypothetical protein